MPRRKQPRGSRGVRSAFSSETHSKETSYDLMVLLPKDVSGVQLQLQTRRIIDRMASMGYTHVALTHTIYGRPRPFDDTVDKALPKSLWTTIQKSQSTLKEETEQQQQPPKKKKQKKEIIATTSSDPPPTIRVLRRLHAVLENVSDVAVFLANGPCASLLDEYDIVSVAPKNDAVFQSVCSSATVADIITLDYHTTRGLRLPFRIRSVDVQAATNRNAAFEIHYAPAILHNKQRKAIVQACHEFHTNSGGKENSKTPPLVLFSSGDRTFEESDAGTLALRMPGDLINLIQTIFHFDSVTSLNAIKRTGGKILRRAEERRWGKSDIVDVQMETEQSLLEATRKEKSNYNELEKASKQQIMMTVKKNVSADTAKQGDKVEDEEKEDDEDLQDGFISM